jgi:hypothetical protein
VLDDDAVAAWCAPALGARPDRILFRAGHLAQVLGIELADGQQVVVKIRPFEPRIAGCVVVQAHLAAAGFPCPAPLAGPDRAGDLTVTAEALLPPGTQLAAERGAAPFAALLARLVCLAPPPGRVPALTPSPPWNGWEHPGRQLWPDRDDEGRDLNEVRGPAWIDSAAAAVRERLSGCRAPVRVGHGDWESQNLRWTGARPLAVHDWDSVIAQPEVAIAGQAAAVWPAAAGPGEAATVGQSADFLAGYQAAASQDWDAGQLRDAWAAGLWVRLFNAKKDAASGGGAELERLDAEVGDRLALAGLPGRSG